MVPPSHNLPTRIISLVLAVVFMFSLSLPAAFATTTDNGNGSGSDFSSEVTSVANDSGSSGPENRGIQGNNPLDLINRQTEGTDSVEDAELPALSADDPGVVPTRIVAWPKESSDVADIEESILEAADNLDALQETEILANPEEEDYDTLVIVESDAEITEGLIDEMMASGLYEIVEFDAIAEPMGSYSATPNDPYYSSKPGLVGSWGLNAFPGANFSAVWPRLGLARGNAQTAPIAVIDTGFDMTIEDRGSNIVAGYDFGSMRSDVAPQSSVSLASHGTGTAGVIAASTNNRKGVAGAAWDNQVVVYKAANADNTLYLSAVTNAINDVVAKRNARIISMSLGGEAFPTSMKKAIDSAVASGVLVIASAGNNAQKGNPILYPAAYPPVFSVASIGPTGEWSNFSTYNSNVGIAAPGELIAVLGRKNTYGNSSGTSFAAPHVAAAAALVWRANPDLSAVQVQNVLKNTAHPIGARGNPKTGAGALDAKAAFEATLRLPFQPKITKVSRGKNSVTLTWNRDTLCSYPSKAYVLQYRLGTSDTWTTVTVKSSNKTASYKVTGLKENTKYYFRVGTINDNGKGPFSKAVASTTFPLSIMTTKSTVRIQRGKTATIRVAPKYYEKKRVKVNWSSSKPKVAGISNTGSSALNRGKGSWTADTLTNKNVSKNGKKINIKGKTKGTSYITFSSDYARHKVKVVVY